MDYAVVQNYVHANYSCLTSNSEALKKFLRLLEVVALFWKELKMAAVQACQSNPWEETQQLVVSMNLWLQAVQY